MHESKEEFRKNLHLKFEKEKAEFKTFKEQLMKEDPLDEDGYPTETALALISKWHWSDPRAMFEFIKSIWAYLDFGWKEVDEPHDFKKDEMVKRYYISTAGWSGNESIIKAMQQNEMMWHLNWVQSRRGGHYIFELREFEE